jgi:hypothetical protein
MSRRAINAFSRAVTASITRRGSLLTLSAAAIGAATAPSGSDAKKKGQDCGKKAKQRCTNDAASCKAFTPTVCSDGNPTCIAIATQCCEKCSANGFLTCIQAAAQPNAAAMVRLA